MAMKKSRLKIVSLANKVYKKCECCDRVKDVYFTLLIYDAPTGEYLQGTIALCRVCGENLGDVLNIPVTTDGDTGFKFN
ncbi:hypothetical protein QI30_19720 [Kurthia sp. 3B1D]|uniref:Uncharacterized protein n=1 Tax=Candidatus Kurthia intestinigallinarum TaxID=1562256 RepID=A0A433RNK7_9BACL|nr:hypothetical protein [Kurthia sp. 3B1D]RUS49737.1 hypothetical protein QI30_19720 [Kurthia sp. 3B1D]